MFKVGDLVETAYGDVGTIVEFFISFNGVDRVRLDNGCTYDMSEIKRVISEPWYDFKNADATSSKLCDCGGWAVGTHSHWCSAPNDNQPRKKGLDRHYARSGK